MESKPDRVRALANSLDCFTSDELRELAGITESTEDAWCKRHTGPSYIIFGNTKLYPRKAVAEHLQGLIRERNAPGGKVML